METARFVATESIANDKIIITVQVDEGEPTGHCWYPWDGGPLIINPIYTLYHVGIYWGPYPLLKGSNRGVKQLGYHPKGTSIFPMIGGGFKYVLFLPLLGEMIHF